MYTRETGVGVLFLHLEELDDNTSLFRLEFFLLCLLFPFSLFFIFVSHFRIGFNMEDWSCGLVGVFNRRRWHLDPSDLVWTGG